MIKSQDNQAYHIKFGAVTTEVTCMLTLTTSFAASSAGKPRQACAAISEDTASHIPSDAIISLPPAFESYDIPKHTY